MKILIPMAGNGTRFNDEHEHTPKPLTLVDGVPMIVRVANMFDAENDEYIFVCQEKHLAETNMREVLTKAVKHCTIVSITESQIAGGPTHSASHAFHLINDDEEVIVNYSDFLQVWDYQNFLKEARSTTCDGAIISFKGFHPASLGETYYAFLKVNEMGYVSDLREKEPFNKENRMEDYASTGTYYFKRGKTYKDYSRKVMETGFNVKGETYVTLPLILMLKDNLKVLNHEVPKFICLGTIRDYKVYNFWSSFFWHRAGKEVEFKNDLKTKNQFPLFNIPDEREFNYWQEYFSGREDHPYKIGLNYFNVGDNQR